MLETVDPAIIGYTAGGLFVAAYLIINQVLLRLVVMLGAGFYIWYYFIAAADPLWEAIYLSIVMGFANLFGLAALYVRGSEWAVPTTFQDIHGRFPDLPPGDFRRLMRPAKRRVLAETECVTVQNQPADKLVYIVSGDALVKKDYASFQLPAGLFIGEVAYLTGDRSAATVWVSEGSEVVEWSLPDLRRVTRREHVRLTLEAMISRDMAAKLAKAVSPHSEFNTPHVRLASVETAQPSSF